MKIDIINSRVYSNPYQQLLYGESHSRYGMIMGSIERATIRQRLTKCSLFHIHWEESLFSKCSTVADAVKVRRAYIDKLRRYEKLGGKIVWTLHNIKPHEARFVQTFFALRRDLAELSHRILVHNQAAISVLHAQTGWEDLSKVAVLPHPAYLDVYEPIDRTRALLGQAPVYPRTLLHFGMVRAYKGIPSLVRSLSPKFMAQHQLGLHICGQPHRADSFLNDLLEQTRGRPEIRYSLASVPDEEVADLLRSYAGLVIPYHNVLTSGVAVLSLSLGIPTVTADTPAMRELYPESSHHLLFNPRSPNDLRRAVLALVDLPAEMRQQISRDYFERAFATRSEVISQKLGGIYDDVLGPSISLRDQRLGMSNLPTKFRVPFMIQLMSENKTMATRARKPAATSSANEQLALELVKATLLSNVRTGVPDELILEDIKSAHKLVTERARLDGGYAVRLYRNILSRLEAQSAELTTTVSEQPAPMADKKA